MWTSELHTPTCSRNYFHLIEKPSFPPTHLLYFGWSFSYTVLSTLTLFWGPLSLFLSLHHLLCSICFHPGIRNFYIKTKPSESSDWHQVPQLCVLEDLQVRGRWFKKILTSKFQMDFSRISKALTKGSEDKTIYCSLLSFLNEYLWQEMIYFLWKMNDLTVICHCRFAVVNLEIVGALLKSFNLTSFYLILLDSKIRRY